jgi:hypothetical protein
MRVAGKPAFAVVVGAALFLAQDIFMRVTHIVISPDEAIGIVTLGSWLAYYIVPADKQA